MSDKKTTVPILANENANVKLSSRKKRVLELLDKANSLATTSGCYLMKNLSDEIIYVGKAKNLKARVVSYFNNSQKNAKTTILVGHVRSFDFILTNSDPESFVLENNLIKEHRPKYNIRLKDDKSYPYVQINKTEAFPRLEYVRRPKKRRKYELFGPFPVGSNISEILKVLTKTYGLRDCSTHEFKTRITPCILFQMKQCSASCTENISEEEYNKDLDEALSYFKGEKKFQVSLNKLKTKMMKLAENEEFEQAAFLRDQITVLENFGEKSFNQNVELQHSKDIDIVSYFIGEEEVDISLYLVRRGNLLGHKNFHFLKSDMLEDSEEEISRMLIQYYSQNDDVLPENIITPFDGDLLLELGQGIKSLFLESLKISIQGKSKKYESLISMTYDHARESQRVRIENQDSVFVGLNRLKSLLNMKERPRTMECYDIAIWQGKSPTASQVVFYEGKADKSRYRHYHMQELPEGNNDFAMMKEVFTRRLKKGDLPDVFVVDGGIQQVNTVQKVLDEFGLVIPLVGIAKARDLKKAGFRSTDVKLSEERLVIPGRSNPFNLNKCPSLFRIIVQMRDEAHRFSRRLHHKTEHKRVIHSWVDGVKGLNQNAKDLILRNNTSSKNELKKMNIGELEKLLGIAKKHAKILYEFLHA